MMRSLCRSAMVGVVLGVWAASAPAASLTWKINGANAADWNTSTNNWLTTASAFTTYVDGSATDVVFNTGVQAAGAVYIGTGPATPVDVTPKSWTFAGTGSWTFTGGNILGTGKVTEGWDNTVTIASNRSFDFSGGVDLAGGWMNYAPSVAGSYHFGTGPIVLGYRGSYNYFWFKPSVAGCTLTNDFTVSANGSYQYGAQLRAPTNGGVLTGNLNMNGDLSVGDAAWSMTSPVVMVGGNRRIDLAGSQSLNSKFQSPVSGGTVLTLAPGGNTPAFTDYYWFVDGAATWTISGFTKDGTGNLSFSAPRNLGSTVTLRTGAAIMGGAAANQDWIPDTAAVNFTGGKLVLRGDLGAVAKTETVGSLNINTAYSELRVNALSAQHTLQSTGALTRANDATALVAMNTNTLIKLPSAPTMIGGGTGAGTTTISIVPWLAGSTLTNDSATGIGGDYGSTFLTFDSGTMSLRPLNTGTEFAANLAGAGATTNVRKAAASETLAANASINSLVFSATGAPRTIDGAYKLTINSGSILTTSDAWANSATISTSQLDFNGQEANIFVTGNNYAQVKTIISSDITNASKVIKSGFGALYLTGTNSFTGPLVQNAGGLGGNNADGIIVRGTLATTDVRIMRDNLVLEGGDNRLNPATVLTINTGADVRTNRQFAGDPTTMNQTIRGVVNGPNGAGSLSGSGVYNHTAGYTVGTPTLNLTLNPGAGDNYTFAGGFGGINVIKDGAGTQTVGSLSGPASVEFKNGLLINTGGARSGTFRFNGGFYSAPSMRDWGWATSGNAYYAVGDVGLSSNLGSFSMGPANAGVGGTYEWNVAPFLLNGKKLMFNRPDSTGYVGFEYNFSLGNTAGTPQLREIFVDDNPTTAADYGLVSGTISGTAADKTLIKTGPGTLSLASANTYAGPTRIDAGVLLSGNMTSIPGGIALVGGTSNIALNGGVLGLGNNVFQRNLGTGVAQIQWTGSGGFAAYGTRSVNLGNAAATVQWNVNSFVPTGSALILGAGDATGTLTFQNPIDLNGGQRTIQVDNGSLPIDAILSGALSNSTGTGGLTKTGLGTLQLGVVGNSYNGPTNVNAGTLLLAGPATLTTSQINVAGGATFGGIGTATTTVSAIGTNATTRANVSPGQSIGALSVTGNVTLGDYSSLITEINSAGGSDVLNITGNLNLSSLSDRLDLWLTGGATYMTGTYTVATWTGSLTGTFNEIYLNGSPITNFIGGNYFPVYSANGLTLVPEPGAVILLAGAALAALRRRARRG